MKKLKTKEPIKFRRNGNRVCGVRSRSWGEEESVGKDLWSRDELRTTNLRRLSNCLGRDWGFTQASESVRFYWRTHAVRPFRWHFRVNEMLSVTLRDISLIYTRLQHCVLFRIRRVTCNILPDVWRPSQRSVHSSRYSLYLRPRNGRRYYILPLKFLSSFFFQRRISEMALPTGNLCSSDGRI